MSSRRVSRIFDERTMDWGSDLDDHEEEDLVTICIRREFAKGGGFGQIVVPFIQPLRTNFGPTSLHDFLRKRLDEARAEERLEKNIKPRQEQGHEGEMQKYPRPGFQRPIKKGSQRTDKDNVASSNRKRDNILGEDSDDTSLRHSHSQQQRNGPSDQDSPSNNPRSGPSDVVDWEPRKADKSSNRLSRKHSMTRPSSQSRETRTSSRRSTKVDLSDLNDEDDSILLPSQGDVNGIVGEAGNHNKENFVVQPRVAKSSAKITTHESARQSHGATSTAISYQRQAPSLISDLEAFQQEDRRRFASKLAIDTNKDATQDLALDEPESRRNSRKAAFEEHVNAKKQTRRKEDESASKRPPGNAQDIDDDDSPRVRKPPSGKENFPLLIDNPSASAIPRYSASSVKPPSQQASLAALVDGISNDLLAAVPNDRPNPSPTIPDPRRDCGDQLLSAYDDTSTTNTDVASPSRSSQASRFRSSSQFNKIFIEIPTVSTNTQIQRSLFPFEYDQIVPEILPADMTKSANVKKKPKTTKLSSDTIREQHDAAFRSSAQNLTSPGGISGEGQAVIDFPRNWIATDLSIHPNDPPSCPLGNMGSGWPEDLSSDLFTDICQFLSHDDVRNLRLVNKVFANVISPILFRSVVTNFGRTMFDINKSQYDGKPADPPSQSLFEQLGEHINRFGISFEVDLMRLPVAEAKVISLPEKSWFGEYQWPVAEYPRFKDLKSIEDLVDNNSPLLRDVLRHLSKTSELALSIDSGHGWLNGADLSDLAIYRMRRDGGSKVFGKTFRGENKWHEHGMNELVKWAQQNTINEALKVMHRDSQDRSLEIAFLKSVVIRDYESFRAQATQPDRDRFAHTGGRQQPIAEQLVQQVVQQHLMQQMNLHHLQGAVGAMGGAIPPNAVQIQPSQVFQPHNLQQLPRDVNAQAPRRSTSRRQVSRPQQRPHKTLPQWPIIFNGHNLAAEVGGHCSFIQNKVAPLHVYPLRPGELTEAQAQWLMETIWAQRGFLSAYTTAVIMNKASLRTVHSLHIAKLSSGLLPSLAQREFWSALPGVKTLTLLISPDWRIEHIPGDRAFNKNMLISPVQASIKLAEFLHQYVSRIEHLSSLSVGFVGGGEHSPGICARNQNILPAPVTSNPRSWLSDHKLKPDSDTMMKFDHIRDLTFQNCWFSPCMLEGFMIKSRDTSLRHLILDSVSLTGTNSSRTEALSSADNHIRTHHGVDAWLQEKLPNDGCWPNVLDRLTPGETFFERKVAAGMIPEHQIDLPENQREFRGNVEKITLKSCGYVKIGGIAVAEFNQNSVIISNRSAMDEGLRARKNALEYDGHGELTRRRQMRTMNNVGGLWQPNQTHGGPGTYAPHTGGGQGAALGHARRPSESGEPTSGGKRVMMTRTDPETDSEYTGLGKMTQVVHPVEMRVLEQAWGMTFGWGDDMERWAAVEDGWFEGGTGRFSGVVAKNAAK